MRDFAIPAVITALSLASSVMAQSKVEQSEGAMALEKIRRVPDLNQKSFAGQNGRSIDCPLDARVHEIMNINISEEIGKEFALYLYPPGDITAPPLWGASGMRIFAIVDFSDGGVSFPLTRNFPLVFIPTVPTANFQGITFDWKQGAVIPIPAGHIRVSALILSEQFLAPTIRLGASVSYNSHPRTAAPTVTQKAIGLGGGAALAASAIPPLASKLRIETTDFSTRTFRVQFLDVAGIVTSERVVAPGADFVPMDVPADAWFWQATNLGLAAVGGMNFIWDLSL